ncbi:hypothetical protein GF376_03645 [Candidatus Peregrinibacteria bacterium]|nr:hypothetical protein [Candidatus Peregrinibacteria bacterium]
MNNLYNSAQYLTEALSNNAFDFQERKKINPNPQLYLPALKKGNISDVKKGKHIVFEALNDQGEIEPHLGLEKFVQIGEKIFIIDNHNHAFFFWHLADRSKIYHLIHIDQHRDSRIPANFLSKNDSFDLKKVHEYTNTILNVGNFIPAAVKTQLISTIDFITSESSIKKFERPNAPYILDIDLDFFAPELDYIDNEKKIELINSLVEKAEIITIATSPFFIDQDLAIKWLKKLTLPDHRA